LKNTDAVVPAQAKVSIVVLATAWNVPFQWIWKDWTPLVYTIKS